MSTLFVGIKGRVIAVDRRSGETLWSTHLKGSQFVTVAVENGAVYAGTSGRLFCLDPSTGSVRWTNELPGMGYGLICIAGADASPLFGENKRRQEASHSSAGAA
jgi:outer membrane protein assembly factor BamB